MAFSDPNACFQLRTSSRFSFDGSMLLNEVNLSALAVSIDNLVHFGQYHDQADMAAANHFPRLCCR